MAAPLSDPVVFDTDVAVIGSGFGGSVTVKYVYLFNSDIGTSQMQSLTS